MAQILFLPAQVMNHQIPSSPDPTPLRLLAFSVAEAALQPDPNSPSLAFTQSAKNVVEGDWVGSWNDVKVDQAAHGRRPFSGKVGGRRLWDVVEKAKERRIRISSSPSEMTESLPPSPPISPASYSFVLPHYSPLAASPDQPPPSLANSPIRPRAFPLYTRSAEPSPTRATFSALDQSRPPPVFIPRISANDFAAQKSSSTLPSDRLRSQAITSPSTSRHTARMPSLAQIQAKMKKAESGAGHKRGSSTGSVPLPVPAVPRINTVQRTCSEDSVELLQTPTDENPPCRPRIVLAGALGRRPPTPPSPVNALPKEGHRLAPFLRQRTSGRLAGAAKARPVSMPPLRGFSLADHKPVLTVTPPSAERARPTVPQPSPAKVRQANFTTSSIIMLNTPLNHSTDAMMYQSIPHSPTGSTRYSVASPTLSVPRIICTPAPERISRDGLEYDSDEESGDVVLFEGEIEKDEREKRGKEMLIRLNLKRRCLD